METNFNPLQNLSAEELIYIKDNSEVHSRLWNDASAMLIALQMSQQLNISNQTK